MISKPATVLLFPWLGHGHNSPFLELAKELNNSERFIVYICSTPANLVSVKKTLKTEGLSLSIHVIELLLPELPGLPSNLHSTNGLPLHLMPVLKQAFDMSAPKFEELLKNLSPDLLIYDILQPWAPTAAASFGIPSVVFITTSVAASMYHFHLNAPKDDVVFPFGNTIYYHKHEMVKVATTAKEKEEDIVTQCVTKSSSIVLIKSFKEIEGKYADHLSLLIDKKIVPVGPLVADPFCPDTEQNTIILNWLDTKAIGSTVFVSFGSEYFLSSHDLEEIAFGLEMSNVNFIWVLRFPKSDKEIDVSGALPLGFLERVKHRGLIVTGWAPQSKILRHKNIGGFVSHCGWSSVLEAMKFGVPIVAMPMHLDQPINARLVAEVGNGLEVVREEGRLLRKNVANVIQQVVVSELGVAVKKKAKNLQDIIKKKQNKEMGVAVGELLQLCKSVGVRGGLTIHRRTKSDGFNFAQSDYLYVDQGDSKTEANRFTEKISQEVKKAPPPASHIPPMRTKSDGFTLAHWDYLYADQGDLKIEANKFTEVKKTLPPALPPKRMLKTKG